MNEIRTMVNDLDKIIEEVEDSSNSSSRNSDTIQSVVKNAVGNILQKIDGHETYVKLEFNKQDREIIDVFIVINVILNSINLGTIEYAVTIPSNEDSSQVFVQTDGGYYNGIFDQELNSNLLNDLTSELKKRFSEKFSSYLE